MSQDAESLPRRIEITLVANNDTRGPLCSGLLKHLLVDRLNQFERASIGYQKQITAQSVQVLHVFEVKTLAYRVNHHVTCWCQRILKGGP